jgi:PadR family transcriptional regulator, regulatory protein AphA
MLSRHQLSPTSYLVLGLLAREGPSTPYDLKRHVAATLGHFWSFPHALLYAEPPRLVKLGLATETREDVGRRRRTFTISDEGADAVRAWLERPSGDSTELRDPGLLQLYFADLGSSLTAGIIARDQLAIHRATLATYEEGERKEQGRDRSSGRRAALQRWHGHRLRMGTLYERAAVDFWEGVAGDAAHDEALMAQATTDEKGAPGNLRRVREVVVPA